MLDEPRRKTVLSDLPQFFEADSVLLRLTFGIEAVTSDGLLRQRSARSLRAQHIFAEQFHPPREARLRMTVPADAHITCRDPDHLAFVAVQKLRRRKPGIDLDPDRLGAGPEPASDCPKRSDEIAMVAHQSRHRPIGQSHPSLLCQKIELVGCDLRFERAFRVRAPVWR